MTTKEKTGFKDQYQPNHQPEDDSGDAGQASDQRQSGYSGFDQENVLEALNRDLVQFKHELEKFNPKAALAFHNQHNPAEYSRNDRKDFVESYAKTINGMEWDRKDRLEAAREITRNLFQPLRSEVQGREDLKQYLGYDVHQVNAPGGESISYIRVRDEKTARRMVEESGGELYVIDTVKMDQCQRQFEHALYTSDVNEKKSRREMEKALEGAISVWKGEYPDRDFNATTELDLVERKLEHRIREMNAREKAAEFGALNPVPEEDGGEQEEFWKKQMFWKELNGFDEGEKAQAVNGLADERMKSLYDAVDRLAKDGTIAERETNAAAHAIRDIAREELLEALEKEDRSAFFTLAGPEGISRKAGEFAGLMERNEGFIKDGEWEFRKDRFTGMTGEDVTAYVLKAREYLEENGDSIGETSMQVAGKHLNAMEDHVQNRPDWYQDGLGELSRMAEGVDYALRPEDPEFWKLCDEASESRGGGEAHRYVMELTGPVHDNPWMDWKRIREEEWTIVKAIRETDLSGFREAADWIRDYMENEAPLAMEKALEAQKTPATAP